MAGEATRLDHPRRMARREEVPEQNVRPDPILRVSEPTRATKGNRERAQCIVGSERSAVKIHLYSSSPSPATAFSSSSPAASGASATSAFAFSVPLPTTSASSSSSAPPASSPASSSGSSWSSSPSSSGSSCSSAGAVFAFFAGGALSAGRWRVSSVDWVHLLRDLGLGALYLQREPPRLLLPAPHHLRNHPRPLRRLHIYRVCRSAPGSAEL